MARVSFRDQLRNLTQPGRYSNRALARELGVDEKSIRRWKSGERKFDAKRMPDVAAITKLLDREVRSVLRTEAKREGYKLPDLPVIFPVERDKYREIPGVPTPVSTTVTYDVAEAEETPEIEGDLFNLLRQYRDRAAAIGGVHGVRFLVRTTKYIKRGIAEVTHWWPTRTEAQPDITAMSDEELKDLIAEARLYAGDDGDLLKVRIGDAYLTLD